jgi:2-iminobutanoate/2-iminopropanoate deaminase
LGQRAARRQSGDTNNEWRTSFESFKVMLESVGSDLKHTVHINVFLKDMSDFGEMNRAYIEKMGNHLPARTVVGVVELPKSGAVLTMNLTAVARE